METSRLQQTNKVGKGWGSTPVSVQTCTSKDTKHASQGHKKVFCNVFVGPERDSEIAAD